MRVPASTTLILGGRPLRVKVLTSERDKQIGFQFAKVSPPPNKGLMFVFSEPSVQSFHMKNVPFDLELLAFSKAGIFLGSQIMKAGTGEKGGSSYNAPNRYISYQTHPDTAYVVEVAPEGAWGSLLKVGVSRLRMLNRNI